MHFDRAKLAALLRKDNLETSDMEPGTLSVEQARKRKKRRKPYDEEDFYKAITEMSTAEMIEGPFVKAASEWRYTLGPVFAPNLTDKHGEWTTDDEMHKGAMRYQLQKDKRLRLQHNEFKEVGTVLSVFRWPFEVETMLKAGMSGQQVVLPAGTVYAEVLWDEKPWNDLVKTGRVTGFSMGGRAKRVRVAVDEQPSGE